MNLVATEILYWLTGNTTTRMYYPNIFFIMFFKIYHRNSAVG